MIGNFLRQVKTLEISCIELGGRLETKRAILLAQDGSLTFLRLGCVRRTIPFAAG